MSKFNQQIVSSNTDQMTLGDIDQAKSDVTAALDGADNAGRSAKPDNVGFNEAVGAMLGLSPIIAAAQVIADLAQPQQQQENTQTRDFLSGKKKDSRYISRSNMDLLVRRAEPVVRATAQPVSLLQVNKRKPALLGAKPASKGADLRERSAIAGSSLGSPTKGARASRPALSREEIDRLKMQLGRLQNAEQNLSGKAFDNGGNDARVKNALSRFSQEQQIKFIAKMPEGPKLSAPKAPSMAMA